MNILEKLNIDYPIFLAPMAGVSSPELAAVVANSGGLGALGLAADSVDKARNLILETQKLTNRSFQVNFFCHKIDELDKKACDGWIEYLREIFLSFGELPPKTLNPIYPSFIDSDDYLNLVLETTPKAVSFHFGLPLKHQLEKLKESQIVTIATATNLTEAKILEEFGIDLIVAQGIEAGGHRGIFNTEVDAGISTWDLVKLLHKHIETPIVAAGGIMNGSDIQDFLNVGAVAAQLGTAFIQCNESIASKAYKQALFLNNITQITDSISGRPARGLFNKWHEMIDTPTRPKHPGYPYTYDLGKQLINIASHNNVNQFGAFWAGMNVSKIRRFDALELMQILINELGSKYVK